MSQIINQPTGPTEIVEKAGPQGADNTRPHRIVDRTDGYPQDVHYFDRPEVSESERARVVEALRASEAERAAELGRAEQARRTAEMAAVNGDPIRMAARVAGVPEREVLRVEVVPQGTVIHVKGGPPVIDVAPSNPDAEGRSGLLIWDASRIRVPEGQSLQDVLAPKVAVYAHPSR